VLLSTQGMDVAMIARVTFTSADRVRDVLHNFNADGFDSLRPRYAGGRPPKFGSQQRDQIKKIALGRPVDHGLRFSTWSLSKLADYLVAQGWSRTSLMRACGCCCASRVSPFQAVKT
jgi:transposase